MKKPKTKVRKKPAPAKLASSATTALVRIAKDIQAGIKEVQSRQSVSVPEVLPPERLVRTTEEEVVLLELKLTPEEEKVLAEPVNEADVLIKPDGAVYLSHIHYTRWFNRAFGRLGWAIEPARMKPEKAGNAVIIPYVLKVHEKPVVFTWGEQEYFESNRAQSYGDAIEATVGNALRRLAKRMGVSLELWDRDWSEAWKAKHAIRVKVKGPRDDKPRNQWRRKTDSPLPWEMGRADAPDPDDDGEREPRRAAPRREAPPAREEAHGHHANVDDLITQGQRQRLVLIIRNSGREQEQVTKWLHRRYKIGSLKDITRRDYDRICSAIESPADLPE